MKRLFAFSPGAAGWQTVVGTSVMLIMSACYEANVAEPMPVASVAGTITSVETGAPVAGASVSIRDLSTTTASDGTFLLSPLALGPATLRVTAERFAIFQTGMVLTAGLLTRSVRLSANGPVNGVSLYPLELTIRVGPVTDSSWVWLTARDTNGNIVWPLTGRVTFRTDHEELITLVYDYLCPECPWVYVKGNSPGVATIAAEYRGITVRSTVTVVP